MIFIKVTQTETNCVRGQTNLRPPFLIKKDLEKKQGSSTEASNPTNTIYP